MKLPPFDIDRSHTFDLECTTNEPAMCWLAASTPLASPTMDDTKLFLSIHQVVEYIFQRKHRDHRFYAHNLGYDMSFVLAYLRDSHYEDFIVHHLIQPPMGGMMYICIEMRNIKIHFFDTVIKFAAPLSKVLDTYTNMEKGETPIYLNPSDVVYSDYNDKYCKIDACGLAQAIPLAMEYGTSLTIPSDAFKKWASFMVADYGKQGFKKRYTPISENLDKEMRDAYRGGFTFLNPSYAGKELKNIDRYDVNSMYPAQMRLRELPFGEPCLKMGGEVIPRGKFKLGIQILTFTYAEVKADHCPFIATKKGFRGSNQYGEIILPPAGANKFKLMLTLQEFKLFMESYYVEDLTLDGGWLFQSSTSDFVQYIDEHWQMKCSKDETEKNRGKLFLNALYGKFAEATDKEEMCYNFDEEVLVCRPTGIIESNPKGYLPLGIFITSYARIQLIESINSVGYKNFVYCDTDSIHVTEDADVSGLDMHPERIGAWDYEGRFDTAKYIRAKRYMGITGGKAKVVCAGINKKDLAQQVTTLDDFYEGKEINTRKFKNGTKGKYVKPQITKI